MGKSYCLFCWQIILVPIWCSPNYIFVQKCFDSHCVFKLLFAKNVLAKYWFGNIFCWSEFNFGPILLLNMLLGKEIWVTLIISKILVHISVDLKIDLDTIFVINILAVILLNFLDIKIFRSTIFRVTIYYCSFCADKIYFFMNTFILLVCRNNVLLKKSGVQNICFTLFVRNYLFKIFTLKNIDHNFMLKNLIVCFVQITICHKCLVKYCFSNIFWGSKFNFHQFCCYKRYLVNIFCVKFIFIKI